MQAYKDKPRGYIACQGPYADKLPDFWLMIWQQNVHQVVMLTELVENEEVSQNYILIRVAEDVKDMNYHSKLLSLAHKVQMNVYLILTEPVEM